MVAFCNSISTQIYVGGDWLDISEYVIENIDADWGILNNSPTDRIGYVGGMTLYLNNNSGIFTPNTVSTLSGWDRGIEIRLVLTYENIPYVRFKGKIKRIGLPYKVDNISVVPVNVVDWFDEAINKKFYLEGVQSDVTTAEAVQAVLDAMDNPPDATDIEEGDDILDAVFTTADNKSTAYSELSKLALSEFSYIYLRKDRTYGETLKVEKRQSRVDRDLSAIPTTKTNASLFKLQNGSYLKLQNDALLLLNKSTTVTFDNMHQMDTEYGENLINQLTVRNNPLDVDTSYQTLFSLDTPIEIGAGQTLPDMRISYKDPTGGGRRISGYDMQTPVITTDYQMYTGYTNSGGTGVDLSSYLTFTVEFGAGGAVIRNLTNTSSRNGFITKLNLRGLGVYNYNPIEVLVEDSASQSSYGIAPFTIDNHYQSNLNISRSIATVTLQKNKDNNFVARKIRAKANISADVLLSFLTLDVGDLIHIIQNQHQIDDDYFIHSVKFTVLQGGVIEFEWGLTDKFLASDSFWRLGVTGVSELGVTTVVSY